MLQQQHNVGDRVRLPRRRQAPLQFPSSRDTAPCRGLSRRMDGAVVLSQFLLFQHFNQIGQFCCHRLPNDVIVDVKVLVY